MRPTRDRLRFRGLGLESVIGSLLACALHASMLASPARAEVSLEGGVVHLPSLHEAHSFPALSVRFGPARPKRAGPELALSAFRGPMTADIGSGVFGTIIDVAAAGATPIGTSAALLPRIGVSGVGAVGEGGALIGFGLLGGIGLATVPESGVGLRADLDYRWLALIQKPEGMVSVSAGIVW